MNPSVSLTLKSTVWISPISTRHSSTMLWFCRRTKTVGAASEKISAALSQWCSSPWAERRSASSACVRPANTKGCSMSNAKNKTGYSARDLREVSDNPEWTKEEFAKAKPFAEVFPELAASIRRGRGPNKAPTKKLVSLRLSGQVIEVYKAKGPGWQSRIDADLRRINKIK